MKQQSLLVVFALVVGFVWYQSELSIRSLRREQSFNDNIKAIHFPKRTMEQCFPAPSFDDHPASSSVSHDTIRSAMTLPANVTSMFHLHIQKAGGTALSASLSKMACKCPPDKERQFQPKECKCHKKMARNGQSLETFQSRLTSGWNPCGVHAWWSEMVDCGPRHQNLTVGGVQDDIAVVTTLRDPLKRVLSEYTWCGKEGLCWDWQYNYTSSNISSSDNSDPRLEEFARLDNSFPFQNRQMKMLSGCPRATNWTDPEACEKCLEAAKQNIQQMAFVGLEEARPFFLRVLSDLVGRPVAAPRQDVHLVDAKRLRADPNPNTRRLLARANVYDVQLYDFARDFLCQKYQGTLE